MKTLVKRMVVMSVVLVLLCVMVIAQNEKETKSVNDPNYGVVVSPTQVNLIPGQEQEGGVIVIPNPGYYHPTIYYDGQTYEIGESFSGQIFTVKPAALPFSFKIKAKTNITGTEPKSEIILIFVEEEPVDRSNNKNRTRTGGVPIIITVTP